MSDSKPTYRVGVSVLLVNKQGQVLLGKRKSISGDGWWSTPGGGIEPNETRVATAQRELMEETGLALAQVRFDPIGDQEHFRFGKHYFMFYYMATITDHEASIIQNTESNKCHGWHWTDLSDIPVPCTESATILSHVKGVAALAQQTPHRRAFNQALNATAIAGGKLRGMDYYEFLEDFSGHLKGLMECFRDEHPEDFA